MVLVLNLVSYISCSAFHWPGKFYTHSVYFRISVFCPETRGNDEISGRHAPGFDVTRFFNQELHCISLCASIAVSYTPNIGEFLVSSAILTLVKYKFLCVGRVDLSNLYIYMWYIYLFGLRSLISCFLLWVFILNALLSYEISLWCFMCYEILLFGLFSIKCLFSFTIVVYWWNPFMSSLWKN